jgi:predicted phage-related endonuclease
VLTAEQKNLRKSHIGASDISALFGLDPFKSGADVWLNKTFGVDDTNVQSESMELGNAFEAPMVEWAASELGVQVSINPDDLFGVCLEHPVLSATLDARILPFSSKRAIEIKTTGRSDEYGEEGSDQVADRTLIQCQQQCLVFGLDGVDIGVLLGRNGLKRALYHVERNNAIIGSIVKKAETFWNKYVLTKIQPPPEEFGLGSIDIIKRVIRQPSSWAEVPDEFITAWEAARAARLAAEKVEKEALERMLTPLGDAEGARLSDGRVLCYFPTVKKILDQKTLKSDYKEIYESLLKDSVSRTPRIKGAAE